ncbi:MAG: glutamate racemase [Patescibacteria group bacterium]
MRVSPIGVFDSGLGGLTVVHEIKKLLPNEDIIYLGDTARVPYGTRSKEMVTKFSFEDAKFLLTRKVKCIVIACNTASAFAGEALKKKIKVPVFDVVSPAAYEAAILSRNARIGVIGTRGTIASQAYSQEIMRRAKGARVFEKACPLFVPLIEEGETRGQILSGLAQKYLSYFGNKEIDTLVMGCTHYPIIKEVIQKGVGKKVRLLNPGEAVSRELKNYLSLKNIQNSKKGKGRIEYYVTDLTRSFTKVAEMFLGERMDGRIRKVSLEGSA